MRSGAWLVAVMAVACAAGCSTGRLANRPDTVAFDDLVRQPQRYDGRHLCTEGYRASGFEANALAGSVDRRDGAAYLHEPAIWLERAELGPERDCFTTATSPPARFCRVTACGRFESGGNFGHGGGFRFQLAR